MLLARQIDVANRGKIKAQVAVEAAVVVSHPTRDEAVEVEEVHLDEEQDGFSIREVTDAVRETMMIFEETSTITHERIILHETSLHPLASKKRTAKWPSFISSLPIAFDIGDDGNGKNSDLRS